MAARPSVHVLFKREFCSLLKYFHSAKYNFVKFIEIFGRLLYIIIQTYFQFFIENNDAPLYYPLPIYPILKVLRFKSQADENP